MLDLPNATGHIYSAEEKKWEDGSGLSFANQKAGAGSSSSSSSSSSVANTSTAYEDTPHYSTDNRFEYIDKVPYIHQENIHTHYYLGSSKRLSQESAPA